MDGVDGERAEELTVLRRELEELELGAAIAEAKARITEANVRNIQAQIQMSEVRARLAEKRRAALVEAP